MAERVLVALGSNLGDRRAYLASARNRMSLLPGTRIEASSRIEETAPLGTVAQGAYFNQMVDLRTTLAPRALLDALHAIEVRLGRVRRVRWGARTIDLDIVRHGAVRSRDPRLVLPHPGIASRPFWQREIAELDALAGDAS